MRAPRPAIYLRESGLRGAQLTGNSASPAAFVSLPSAEVGSDAGASRAVPPPAAPRSPGAVPSRPGAASGGAIAPGPERSLPLSPLPPSPARLCFRPAEVLRAPRLPSRLCEVWRSGRYFLALIVCAERKESYRIVGIIGTNRDWQKGEEGSISFVFKGIRLVDVSTRQRREGEYSIAPN